MAETLLLTVRESLSIRLDFDRMVMGLEEGMQFWASLAVVLAFFGSMFSYFVLRPLYGAIQDLRLTLKDLRDDMKKSEERRHVLEVRLAEVDQSTRSAHHRLDDHINKEG